MLTPESKVFVAGHQGMVGSAIIGKLKTEGFHNLVTRDHSELDLIDQLAVQTFFAENKVDLVILAAAKVGGIFANNTYPAEFIYQNLMIQLNVIHGAYKAGVCTLLFLGSSCIYPKHADQPIHESALLSGTLEPTNEPYAIAKIAGIKLCESYNRQYGIDYRSIMPTNLYGPNDNFHPENSHVLPALLKRFHDAKINQEPKVVIWGSGRAKREFLHVNDMAAACFHLMRLNKSEYQASVNPMQSHINAGTGQDVTIRELAEIIQKVVGYNGRIEFDESKPDGTPRKLLEVSKLTAMGWRAEIRLEDGVESTYRWYLNEAETNLRL